MEFSLPVWVDDFTKIYSKIIHPYGQAKLQDFFAKNISDVWMINTQFCYQLFIFHCTNTF